MESTVFGAASPGTGTLNTSEGPIRNGQIFYRYATEALPAPVAVLGARVYIPAGATELLGSTVALTVALNGDRDTPLASAIGTITTTGAWCEARFAEPIAFPEAALFAWVQHENTAHYVSFSAARAGSGRVESPGIAFAWAHVDLPTYASCFYDEDGAGWAPHPTETAGYGLDLIVADEMPAPPEPPEPVDTASMTSVELLDGTWSTTGGTVAEVLGDGDPDTTATGVFAGGYGALRGQLPPMTPPPAGVGATVTLDGVTGFPPGMTCSWQIGTQSGVFDLVEGVNEIVLTASQAAWGIPWAAGPALFLEFAEPGG